uniref:non-specific serine/threonine protein kinase n=1 Tax=Leersia perrieri TaxID=77586 RepID=A0A0D9WE19_9ORYZ
MTLCPSVTRSSKQNNCSPTLLGLSACGKQRRRVSALLLPPYPTCEQYKGREILRRSLGSGDFCVASRDREQAVLLLGVAAASNPIDPVSSRSRRATASGCFLRILPHRQSTMVFLKVEMSLNVLISPGKLSPEGLLLRKAVIVGLLEDIANRKASKDHGYYIAVSELKAISEGKVRELTGDVLFPVTFTCITQKPMKGEVLVGSVDKILKHGVFLKSGPIESIFLPEKTMSDYKYIGGENAVFMSEHSKLEKDTVVRFKVMGFRWMEADRQFQLLATLAGHYLGPLIPSDPSFATTFVFAITTSNVAQVRNKGGDGIAFVFSSTNKFINHSLGGQYLGLFNASNKGNTSQNILAIKLGTVMNPDLNDIDDNHVGIDVNSLIAINSRTVGYITSNGEFQFLRLLDDRYQSLQLWVDYDGKSHQLNVTLGLPDSPKPDYPLLSSTVNLSSLFPSSAYIGFSASTSALETRQFILGWSFKNDGKAPPLDYSTLSVPERYGWGANNYFAPPPPHPELNSHQVHIPLRILLSTVIPSCVLLVAVAFLGSYCMKRWKNAGPQEDWEIKCRPPSFIYKDLHNATAGFSDKMLLGKGGFGRVYRGFLPASKQNIAIKRISPESKQGMKEFMSEIAILGNVRHRSLVQLLGYCRNKHELLLVYDYMPNGSLDKYLYGEHKLALGWSQIFRIIKGVACGLFYLHEEWERVIIHRDIKSSNVLLDEEMNGRLGDFGLARLHDHGVDAHTTHVAGTYGYIAPELARLGKSTKGTDVFAFVVFMMEVACGKKSIEVNASGEPQVLSDYVLNTWQCGSIINSIDPSLKEDYIAEELELVLKLGLLCSHSSPKVRPSMRLVMQYLEKEATLQDFTFSFFSTNEDNIEVYGQNVVSNPSVATTITSLTGGR